MIQEFHSGHRPKRLKKQGLREMSAHLCSQQHYSQQPKDRSNPSVYRQMNRQNVLCTCDGIFFSLKKEGYYDAYATTWVNFEDITPSEISPSQKDEYYMVPLRGSTESSPIHRDTQETGRCRVGGRGQGEVSVERVQSASFGGSVAQHHGHPECP